MPNESSITSRPMAGKRNPIALSPEKMVEIGNLFEGQALPLRITARVGHLDPIYWAEKNREMIRSKLLTHGGILFRGFKLKTAENLNGFAEVVSGSLLEYKERSSPRTQVSDKVYTSTDYPADQTIFLHNENSYQFAWPMNIYFFCHTPAEQGGDTPIADCRRVLQRLSPRIVDSFAKKQCMYVRNFSSNFGLPWQEVFQTTDHEVVEEYCSKNGIRAEWLPGNRLRTRTVRPALVQHPVLHESIWFNHVTFFHVSTLAPSVRAMLVEEYGEENLPTNTYYGDGSPIEPDVLHQLRAAYKAETVSFQWEQGDLLVLDNMLVSHGRAPFQGERKVLVAMADPVNRRTVAT